MVVTRAGRLREWSKGDLRLYFVTFMVKTLTQSRLISGGAPSILPIRVPSPPPPAPNPNPNLYFQLNHTNSPPKLAWICLKNLAVLRHYVVVDGCGYTFTLNGRESWWGSTGSGGCTAKCAANGDETWLWPWQYHLSNVFLGSCWSNEYCRPFGAFLARERKKWIPISRWSLRMMGSQPT